LTGVNKSVQYEAEESIFAGSNVTGGTQGDVVIKDNSNITFAAGESIVLGPGFSVEAGSTFNAYIKDFSCTGESQMNMMSVSTHNMNTSNTSKNVNEKFEVNSLLVDPKSSTANEIIIAPNPSNGEFEISTNGTSLQNTIIRIFDLMGNTIYYDEYTSMGGTKKISINKQPAGIYLLKIIDDKGQITTEKVIKK
jgi:hypothetical protein